MKKKIPSLEMSRIVSSAYLDSNNLAFSSEGAKKYQCNKKLAKRHKLVELLP